MAARDTPASSRLCGLRPDDHRHGLASALDPALPQALRHGRHMLVKAALGEKAAGEDRQNRNADHAERQKQALQSPGHQTRDGQKDQERQDSSCASAAEGPFAPVEASVETLDQPTRSR